MLARHAGGDPDAFGELVSAYRAAVYSYLYRCGVRAECRDDLFQEIFLRVHSAAARFDPARAVSPWLFTIVANQVRSHFRRTRYDRWLWKAGRDDDAAAEPEDPHTASEDHEAAETAEWLRAEIQRLPLEQRESLLLYSIARFDLKEIAETLNRPLGTVKTQLRRARMTLADAHARRMARAEQESKS